MRTVVVGPLSVQREPVVVAAAVYRIIHSNWYLVPLATAKESQVTSCMVFAVPLLLTTSPPSVTLCLSSGTIYTSPFVSTDKFFPFTVPLALREVRLVNLRPEVPATPVVISILFPGVGSHIQSLLVELSQKKFALF